MIMRNNKRFAAFWLALSLAAVSCTEEITLELPEGKRVPVVEGSITDEYKRHEVILSYSNGLYEGGRDMISDAEVYVVSDDDTIWYQEQDHHPGHYLTDSVAADKLRWYHLEVRVDDNIVRPFPIGMYADTRMSDNAPCIDSVKLLPKLDENNIPLADDSAAVLVCPYFQTLPDSTIIYNVELYLNGKRFKNRPAQLFHLFPMQGYAGYYFNGPEMLQDNIEVPVGIMNKSYLHEGDVVKVKLYSISKDYMYFLVAQKLAIGVNPVMGAYPAVYSNILSNCDAIGWFNATSVIEGEGVYHEF